MRSGLIVIGVLLWLVTRFIPMEPMIRQIIVVVVVVVVLVVPMTFPAAGGLLGDGVRIFDHPGGTKVRLAPIPGETDHWYRVVH